VVIEDLDASLATAAFGELMCSTYQKFGAQGLITNGWGRDLVQVRKRKFPVFTSGDCCAHGYSHLLNLGLPVNLCGIVVRQGDLIHADANGVLLIPTEILSELPEVARGIVAAEQVILDFIDTGSADLNQLRAVRKEAFHRMALLEREVRGRRRPNLPAPGPLVAGEREKGTNL
jgi:regulator of RNase E activity RraA